MMARSKRILMILENSGYPEDTRVAMEANSLAEAGYEMTLICPTGKRKSRYELVGQVHVYRYPAPFEFGGFWGYLWEYGYSLFCAFWLSLWVFLRRGFDAIHIHCPPDMNCLLGVFYRLLGKKFVMDLHDLSPELYQAQKDNQGSRVVNRALRFFERLACRNASMLIATNQTQHRVQIERGGADPQRCFVVRNGPNELFTNPVAPLDELKIPGQTIVGYVGTMGVQDGVEYLIQAMALIKRQRNDIHAIIVGEGTAVPSLKTLVRTLDLESFVMFTGFVEFRKVPQYIAAFDICVTPDPSNPYNDSCTTIKTMEYMAVGRPTVAFRTPENELSAGDSALYADDVAEFASLICHLADDPVLREEMGRVGHRRIMDSLTWNHQRVVLLDAYQFVFTGVRQSQALASEIHRRTSLAAPANNLRKSESSQLLIESTNCTVSNGLKCQFPYSGKLAKFLQQGLEDDIQAAQLSSSFRWFYRVRPWIPNDVRNRLQRVRNGRLEPDSRWYIPQRLERVLQTLDQPLPSIWPGQAEFAFVLTHDVEELEGFKRVLQLADEEEKLGFRSSWNFVPHKYPIDMGVLQELKQRGHEVAVHGYNHDGRLFFDRKTFDSRVAAINEAANRFDATGFRAPMVHRNLNWMQSLKIEYDSSCFDIDPFQAMPGGVENIWPFRIGRFVELPYTLPQDHTLFITLKEKTTRIWQDKLKFLRRHHGLALMLTHPDYLQSPQMLELYREFLDSVRETSEPWHVLPGELASWFQAEFNGQPSGKSDLLVNLS